MKQGFDTGDGQRVDVETDFKNPKRPFRVAIVCAMWLTGFDVECLSTLYVDKLTAWRTTEEPRFIPLILQIGCYPFFGT